MKIAFLTLCTVGAALGVRAQDAAEDQPVERLARSADQDLQQSLDDLNRLRMQIASEKLPMAQELTAIEEQVSTLRREFDAAQREVDQGHLDLAGIKGDVKKHQDELDYISNVLLDEYARTFESKIHVAETQYCGQAIEAAKQATENETLTLQEKLERQIALVDVSVKRLSDSIGGLRFPGIGVDLQGTVANGQFALAGPVVLFRADAGPATGLVVPQAGSTKPLIRPLDGALQAGIASFILNGDGLIPLDPSRGGALKALVQKTNLVHIFKKGGPIMWPLLFASVLALGTVIERLFFLANERRKRDPKRLERLFEQVENGEIAEAVRDHKQSKDYVVRPLVYALEHRERSLSNALVFAQGRELKRFRRGISVLDTVITLAPLLGLLGTVTGMMGSFSLIGGELSAPGAITGGIAEALIATAFGLGIAITSLIPFNFLNTKLEEAGGEIDSAATQLELLVHPHVLTPAPPPKSPAPANHPVAARA
jgi:biopolymer transport protein ExbB